MALPTSVPKVARKTVTHVFNGFAYKERFVLPDTPPSGSSGRIVFTDSSGTSVASLTTNIVGKNVEFNSSIDLSIIPDGAGFYCYVHLSTQSSGQEHLIAYGTTFVR